MAIDSEVKRKSAATVAAVWNAPSVVPNSTIDNPDRQHIGWSYSGIVADEPFFGFQVVEDNEAAAIGRTFGGVVIR